MVRPTRTDLSPVELKYYPFIISLDINVVEVEMCYCQKYVFQKTQNTQMFINTIW